MFPQDRLLEDGTQNNMHELVEHIQLYRQMVRRYLLVSHSNLIKCMYDSKDADEACTGEEK